MVFVKGASTILALPVSLELSYCRCYKNTELPEWCFKHEVLKQELRKVEISKSKEANTYSVS